MKKPPVDSTQIYDIWENYKKKAGRQHALHFGKYQSMKKQSACNAAGLIKASGLVKALYQVSEQICIKDGQLK